MVVALMDPYFDIWATYPYTNMSRGHYVQQFHEAYTWFGGLEVFFDQWSHTLSALNYYMG